MLGRASDKSISHASKAVVLTKEHKALFSDERRRVEKSGGFVRNGRLQGDTLFSNPALPYLAACMLACFLINIYMLLLGMSPNDLHAADMHGVLHMSYLLTSACRQD